MKSTATLLKEGVFVGFILIIIVYIVGYLMTVGGYPMGGIDRDLCKNWNSSYYMEVCLLLSGMLFHIGFEYAGLNKYYVDNYYKNT